MSDLEAPERPDRTRRDHGRPEHDFLLRCLQETFHDGPRIERHRDDDFDWEYLLRLAEEHRLAPLVYRRLSGERVDSAPEPVIAALESRSQSVTFRNLNMMRTLQRTVDLFEEHGIRALPYKGPSLSAVVHDDVAFRGSKDLDVLLPETDVLAARDLLLENGFRPKQPLTGREMRTKLRGSRHVSVVNEDNIRIELHWRITGGRFPFDVDFERMWRNRTLIDVGNGTIPMISPDELVILLAVHGNHHCWSELAWLCDFTGVIETYDFDWSERLRSASRLGVERMLLVGFQLSHDLAGVEPPPIIQRRIRTDRSVMELSERVVDQFLWTTEPPALSRSQYRIKVRERPVDKLRMLTRQAFMPRQKDFDALPPLVQFYPAAVVCRPVRIGGVIASALADRLRQTRG